MEGYHIIRLLGDFTHLFALFLLIINVVRRRSSCAISGKSQVLLAMAFIARYSNLFTSYISPFNTSMKIIIIIAAITTVFLIYKFKPKYEVNHDQLRLQYLLIPTFLLALAMNKYPTTWDCNYEVLWTFSIFLEAVAILPQLYLVVKKGEAEMIIAYYVTAQAAYRGLYIVNWYYRYVNESDIDWISICSGIVQVIIYAMFFLLPITYKQPVKQEGEEVFTIKNEMSKQLVPFQIYKDSILIPPPTTRGKDVNISLS